MKQIYFYSLFIFFVSYTTQGMEQNSQNMQHYDINDDHIMGKLALARMRQFSACGSIASGFTFFAATASRHMHWPYWAKRMPLFGFISCNAINQIPVITGIENDFKKTSSLGSMINALKKT